MHQKRRRIFGVITASAADIEQREVLHGIIRKAQASEIDIAVISNIYNPSEPEPLVSAENGIYDLILSEEFDGFILLSESIINPDLQKKILNHLRKRTDVPTVVIGTPLPHFVLPQFFFINTSDEADLQDVISHLIEQHGFTEIHILTGKKELQASGKRVEGYRRALESHGIPYQEQNVFYGNFWLNSGQEQARKYISGELAFPQALICCNDYMAYGFLDECIMQDIPIPEKTAVIGYEYIRERRYHSPLLTTYQRNRRVLGEEAVRLLTEKLDSGTYGEFLPPKGTLIHGDTCGCGADSQDIKREIRDMQTKSKYDFLNLFSQLEQRLTKCRTIEEFAGKCREFRFMIRDADKLFLCLYEDWYEEKPVSERMVCYNLLSDEVPVLYHKQEFSCIFGEASAPYYFCPLFFDQCGLGYIVLGFDHPDTFDHIFRNWLKSIANSLEFLCMKNDIRYLTQCQNLSEQRDTLTGMYNEKGMRNAYKSADKNQLFLTALKIPEKNASGMKEADRVSAVLDCADALRQFCGNPEDVCGKVSDNLFLCLIHSPHDTVFLEQHLSAVLHQHDVYMKEYGVDSFVCCSVRCYMRSYAECHAECTEHLEEKLRIRAEQQKHPHYKELHKIRSQIWQNPENTFNSEEVYALYNGSKGYFRQIYRQCYGITLHDDCTSARIARARYLLTVSVLSISEIARRCGYADSKYFMRQFQQETGFTAVQYRNMMS